MELKTNPITPATGIRLMPLLTSLPRALSDEEEIYLVQLRIKLRSAKTKNDVRSILEAEGFDPAALRDRYDPDVAAAISKIFTPFVN